MESKQSSCVRVLLLIIGGITQCLGVKHITVIKGQALTLTCPIRNVDGNDHVEWRNPDGFLMFFNKDRALKDTRYEVVTLTQSDYSVRISNIKFEDGGVYKCLHYGHRVATKRYRITVLSGVMLEKTEHGDKTIIKCSASANDQPPRLSWLMENGLEMEFHPNYVLESGSKKYTAVSLLHVKTHNRPATLKCLAQHSALYGTPLTNFIRIGPQGEETSTTSEYTSTTTEKVITPTLVPHFGSTMYTSSHSQSETPDASATLSTTSYNNTKVNKTTESVFKTTEGTPVNASTVSSNSTSGNGDENQDVRKHKRSEKGNSVLLVILVTCLIFCLIVVLAFFLLRLRRAHIAWKQENEENDQSVESSKSKSSNEEKQKANQQQRGRGIFNTGFTKYKVEEAAANDTRTPPAVIEVPDEKPQHVNHTVLKSCIRETEL